MHEWPDDFYVVVEYRYYLDYVGESIKLYTSYVDEPPRYVKYTPVLFLEWAKWADLQSNLRRQNNNDNENIRPLGDESKNAPQWCKYKFDNLEEFYKYYNNLLVVE